MDIELESTGLKVKGNCVIQDLLPLQKTMLELIESERSSVELDLSGVEAIDTAGVQLLAVCRNNALEKGKTFRINSESEAVREALIITGLESMLEDSEKA
ncbi:MAG: STAS domain-containing protein [SAR324 cluster bacterium]|jgi:anti-anti-sigma factor|nr:STAS domain-containing protein [SAR324 cluster bacterium]